jgi:hypothetical protein
MRQYDIGGYVLEELAEFQRYGVEEAHLGKIEMSRSRWSCGRQKVLSDLPGAQPRSCTTLTSLVETWRLFCQNPIVPSRFDATQAGCDRHQGVPVVVRTNKRSRSV